MIPTPGPEATGAVPSPASQPGVRGGGDASQTTVNGTTTGVGVPSPSGLAQPIGDGIQQTMMDVSSGPSTSTAGPVPSPQLPQETVGRAGQEVRPRVSAVGRTGGDGTLGQVGGLGTAGVTYGAVSTTEVADASGVHGDATAVTQGLSVATESGMASTQINVATGVSGYNPSAANPGSSAEGFETPRSTVYGASAVMQTGAQAFASQWLGRVQSLFGGAANVQPMPQAWAPRLLLQGSRDHYSPSREEAASCKMKVKCLCSLVPMRSSLLPWSKELPCSTGLRTGIRTPSPHLFRMMRFRQKSRDSLMG